MPHKIKTNHYYLPKNDYKDTKRSWFVYAGKAYPVMSCPASVFCAAVLLASPHWKRCDEYCHVLAQDELDYQTRWWLLCCLSDTKRGIELYKSREAAERACAQQKVAG